VCEAAGGGLHQLAKVHIFLTDLDHFPVVNQVMEQMFEAPYPARAAIGVAELPKGARVEVDGIMIG
jgi:enamine deaminase RidA (YjgF/YER057c/UK114 family)